MTSISRKNDNIETLRGLAIILVVMGHVIGSKSDGGMRVEDDSFLRHLYFTFQYLRMPLFTVISGWVYALMPANKLNLSDFFVKKVRRIILPLIFVSATYYTLQSIIPGTNYSYEMKDIWKIIIYPYTFYWFLHSLFLVFIAVSFIDAYNLASTFKKWLVVVTIAFTLLFFRDSLIPESIPNFLGFKGAFYLFPFFLIGVGIKRFDNFFKNPIFIWIMAVILVSGLVFQQLVWYNVFDYDYSSYDGIGLLIGISGVFICLNINFSFRWLVWIGGFAYSIYLFHSFGTSGGRILLNRAGIHSQTIVFLFSLVLGIFVPIVLEYFFKRFGITRILFLGRPFKKSQPNKKVI